MNTETPMLTKDLKPTSVESLNQLVRALNDSREYLMEASQAVKDDYLVSDTLKRISEEREEICKTISKFVEKADETPAEEGTFFGKLRSIWTALRTGLNAGDAKIVLIEAERAEDVMLHKFKSLMSEVPHMSTSVELEKCFEQVKKGHDRILALRNTYQNNDAIAK